MRANIGAKTLFYCMLLTVLLVLYNTIKLNTKFNEHMPIEQINSLHIITESGNFTNTNETNNELDLKYILQWTSPDNVPFIYMGKGRQGFIDRNCSYTNCIVTDNRTYLGDYTRFDVIVFSAAELQPARYLLPERRSPHQKFVFASIESADNYPVCSHHFNGFFNWTWTYRLDSDAKWGYIAIRDSEHNLIGPKVDMHWMKLENMDPVKNDVQIKLKNKTKAAAWLVSNCFSRSMRESYVWDLQKWLSHYGLKIDVFGQCGALRCTNEEVCSKMIEQDYYFYLSFENSFAEDYVTEKLLHALQNYAVPIVYGGANYSRFMPEGIYLNARELGPRKLANKMNELIKNPDLYAQYFRWRNHYSYHKRCESELTDDYCRFCSMLNEDDSVKEVSVYENFKEWWDPPNRCFS